LVVDGRGVRERGKPVSHFFSLSSACCHTEKGRKKTRKSFPPPAPCFLILRPVKAQSCLAEVRSQQVALPSTVRRKAERRQTRQRRNRTPKEGQKKSQLISLLEKQSLSKQTNSGLVSWLLCHGPTPRANPFPKVTDPFCRLPLPTLFHRPEAVNLGDLLR